MSNDLGIKSGNCIIKSDMVIFVYIFLEVDNRCI